MTTPQISLVVLARDNLELTRTCVASLRKHTDVPSELIIVDNGSSSEAASWAAEAADRAVLNAENRGFAVGMNQGLAEARGELVAFINNDTVFPDRWASVLVSTMHAFPNAGIVAPAVTAAGNPATVRTEPGTAIVVFEPFGHLPSGVVYVMRAEQCRALGGWNESYDLATGEDLDLLFSVWANGLDVVLDERVLVHHVSEATRRNVASMDEVQRNNLQQFIDRWKTGAPPPPRLDTCSPEVLAANLRSAAVAALWIERLVEVRLSRSGHPGDEARVRRLERDVTRMSAQLAGERTKLARLTRRRSVKIALGAARLGAPIVRLVRRLGSGFDILDADSGEQRITNEVRRLRPSAGLGEGPLVSVVVLNRDGAHHLSRLLAGLAGNTNYRSFELIVVDNASTDESRSILARDWGFRIEVVENDRNVTFSAGCNQGLSVASGSYVLLLNNDISPINAGWLGAMVDALESGPRLGAVGALLVYPERPGHHSTDPNTGADLTVQHRGIHFRWRRTADAEAVVPWAYNMGVGEDPTNPELARTVEVPAATAACLLVRSDLLRELDGLDEGYTYGVEDVDLCLRIRDAGYDIAVVGASALYHHEFGTQSRTAAERKRASGLSNLRHFSETWAPRLSGLLDLEALEPGAQPLRHRTTQATVVTAGPDPHSHEVAAALDLAAAMNATGRRALGHDGPDLEGVGCDLGDLSLVICVGSSFDVRRVPREALSIAWIRDRVDSWIGREWFGLHDVYVPGTAAIAETLMAAGVPVSEVTAPAAGIQITDVARRFLQRPRIAVKVGDIETSRVGELLSAALIRAGARPRVHPRPAWDLPASHCVDAVINLTGASGYVPKAAHVNVLWSLGAPDGPDADECGRYDGVLTTSAAVADRLRTAIDIPVDAVDAEVSDRVAGRVLALVANLWDRRNAGALGS